MSNQSIINNSYSIVSFNVCMVSSSLHQTRNLPRATSAWYQAAEVSSSPHCVSPWLVDHFSLLIVKLHRQQIRLSNLDCRTYPPHTQRPQRQQIAIQLPVDSRNGSWFMVNGRIHPLLVHPVSISPVFPVYLATLLRSSKDLKPPPPGESSTILYYPSTIFHQ